MSQFIKKKLPIVPILDFDQQLIQVDSLDSREKKIGVSPISDYHRFFVCNIDVGQPALLNFRIRFYIGISREERKKEYCHEDPIGLDYWHQHYRTC